MSLPENGAGDKGADWVWCYVCHRCYCRADAVVENGVHMCAYYPQCDGSVWRDGWPWSRVLAIFRRIEADLPDTPVRDTVYLAKVFANPQPR